jgi:hypothetical protein
MMTFGEQFLFRTQVVTNLHCNVFTKAWANEFEMLFKVKAVWAALVVVFFAVQLVEWFIRSRRVLFLQEPDNPRRSISKPRDELHREFYVLYQPNPSCYPLTTLSPPIRYCSSSRRIWGR